ncbi:MAG: DUF1573 domain-containing protein [Bacteroidetes bacterium]|nr:MAG: DUF1573 domain-containing protein [Bacteroidota bacterium]
MKKLLFLLIISGISACGGSNEVEIGNKTTMIVESVYDAGTVMKGEVIDAEFKVKNTGNYPLVIAEVQGSCSCTVAEKPTEPIQPGGEGVIKAKVNTDKTSGSMISKSVRIVANTEPSVTEVIIRAKVKRK